MSSYGAKGARTPNNTLAIRPAAANDAAVIRAIQMRAFEEEGRPKALSAQAARDAPALMAHLTCHSRPLSVQWPSSRTKGA